MRQRFHKPFADVTASITLLGSFSKLRLELSREVAQVLIIPAGLPERKLLFILQVDFHFCNVHKQGSKGPQTECGCCGGRAFRLLSLLLSTSNFTSANCTATMRTFSQQEVHVYCYIVLLCNLIQTVARDHLPRRTFFLTFSQDYRNALRFSNALNHKVIQANRRVGSRLFKNRYAAVNGASCCE